MFFDTRAKNPGPLEPESSAMALVEWAVQPIWYFKKGTPKSKRLPWRWRFVPKVQRELFSLVWVEREYYNGGFAQYFYNWGGLYWQSVIDGCQRFDIPGLLKVTKEAARFFPENVIPPSRLECRRVIHELAVRSLKQRQDHEVEYDIQDLDGGDDIMIVNEYVFEPLDDGMDAVIDEMYRQAAKYVRSHMNEVFR